MKGEINKEPVKFKAKLKIKTEAIKHEKPVGFSAPKNHSIQATYKRAVQILLRAKKEIATLDDRQVDKQKQMELIVSGTLNPYKVSSQASQAKNACMIVICDLCNVECSSRRQFIKHRNDVHSQFTFCLQVLCKTVQNI